MKRTLHDIASLAARMGVGGIFFANGWQKLEAGLNATGEQFAQLGAPMPGAWAASTMLLELVGGTLLIAGLAVPAVGLVLFAEALAVFVLTAGDTGLPLTGGSINLIVALGAASVLLAVGGAGRISIDHMVVIKRREAEAADDFAADAEADAVISALREPTRAFDPADSRTDKHPVTDPGKGPGKGPVTFPASGESDTGPAAESRPGSSSRPGGSSGARPGSSGSGSGARSGLGSGGRTTDDDDPGATAPRPRLRRKRGEDETTESRSESPATGGSSPGDTLVAGRRPSGKQE